MTRAAVTGGAGFVGSHVVDVLLERGCDDLLVLDDLSTGKLGNLDHPGAFELAEVDVATAIAGRLIEEWKPGVIFHLAAQTDVQTSVRRPIADARVNIGGTLRVLEAAGRVGAKVVFASTGGAMYGDCDTPATEETPPNPCSPYAISKLAAEWYVRRYGGVVLRYANVYGPRQSASAEGGVMATFRDCLQRGVPATVFGDGLQTRDFVYVEDVARATVDAAGLAGDVFNVGTGVETSVLDLAAVLGVAYEFADERSGEVRRSVLDPSKLSGVVGWRPCTLAERLIAAVAS